MPSDTKKPSKKITKTAFVLGLGDIPAVDAVAKAKAAGMTLSKAHVYAIRAIAKAKKKKSGAPGAALVKRGPGRPPGKRGPGRPPGRPAGLINRAETTKEAGESAERALASIILTIGVSRTIDLVERVATKLKAAVTGI